MLTDTDRANQMSINAPYEEVKQTSEPLQATNEEVKEPTGLKKLA